MRIGIGFDAHAFAEGRPLILGGVDVPYHLGLAGHSDADALYHAIGDAVLGALGRDDLGHYFPDDDPSLKNADSGSILASIALLLEKDGYHPANIDSIIIAEEPKMAQFIPQMKENIGRIFNIHESSVGVKATTTEKMGFTGHGEGIAAMAVVLLQKNA